MRQHQRRSRLRGAIFWRRTKRSCVNGRRPIQPTFGDKHALVSAEIARLEGRDADAMRLYEQAIQAARENGFVQNEGLAYEIAARFYAARGVETIARIYLRHARFCYLRWGAEGKVRQLEQSHPWLREDAAPLPSIGTIGAPVEQLELGRGGEGGASHFQRNPAG